MKAQVLPGALGLAIGILLYSFISLSIGILMVWLVWAHHERSSFVFLLAVFTCIGTSASIAQQIHTVVWWRDIKIEQHAYWLEHLGDPELYIAGASYGLDLVLFYIQFACYNIASLLILFWTAALLHSVFQLEKWKPGSKLASLLIRSLAVLIPTILLPLLGLQSVQQSKVGFLVIANFCMAAGLLGSASMLLVILGRYIYTRRLFVAWGVQYDETALEFNTSPAEGPPVILLQPQRSIYDRWFLVRFTVGFIALGAFQAIVIKFQLDAASQGVQEEWIGSADLSLSRAQSEFILFIPGATPPLALFVVFGTTARFRRYIWMKIRPTCLRRTKQPGNEPPSSLEDQSIVSNSQELHAYAPREDSITSDTLAGRVTTSFSIEEHDEEAILGHSDKSVGRQSRLSKGQSVLVRGV